jgi:hypothetical protein
MPMSGACIAEGAPSSGAERSLPGRISDLLLVHEGVRPSFEKARTLARVFVRRHETYVAGVPAQAPHYCFVPLGFPRASPTTSAAPRSPRG